MGKGNRAAVAQLANGYCFDSGQNFWLRSNSLPFSYSDGDAVEQQLLEIVQQASDVSITSDELAVHSYKSWPLTYHLHVNRANLLRPIQHLLTGKVLEIGAGCGAITRFLGEVGGEIVAIEGSKRRAAVAAARCRDLSNVTIIVDSFHQVPVIPQYDVVTLIGVLEYARIYFPAAEGEDSVDALLAYARRFLTPEGILVVAIENQLGLKYFAGYAEDHTGQVMQGIEDRYTSDGVVTFGRVELSRRLAAAGLPGQQWWFPFPDYKVPRLLLSDYLLTHDVAMDLSPLLSSALAADPQSARDCYFSLERASRVVGHNKLFGDLANSFLLIAGKLKQEAPRSDIIGYYYATERKKYFSKQIAFIAEGNKVRVRTHRLVTQSKIPDNLPLTLQISADEEFIEGQHWQQKLLQITNKPGWTIDEVVAWAEIWLKSLLNYANLSLPNTGEPLVAGDLLDALPRNLIIKKDGTPVFIDQEWSLKKSIPFGYLLFRAIYRSFLTIRMVEKPEVSVPFSLLDLFFEVTQRLGIALNLSQIEQYSLIEHELQELVCNVNFPMSISIIQKQELPITIPLIKQLKNYEQELDFFKKIIVDMKTSWNRVPRPLRFLGRLFFRISF